MALAAEVESDRIPELLGEIDCAVGAAHAPLPSMEE